MADTPHESTPGLTRTRILGPSPDPPPIAPPEPRRAARLTQPATPATKNEAPLVLPRGAKAGDAPAPARGSDRLVLWLVLLAILAIMLPAVLIDLRRPAVTMPREAAAVAVSIETWRRQAAMDSPGWLGDRLLPLRDGRSLVDQAPGTTWLHLCAFMSLEKQAATPQRMVYRARLVSAIAALVAVAGVFWAGYAIGGLNPAVISAFLLAGCPAFLYYGRVATADMPALAFSIVSAAAALWAMRPHRRPPSRGRQALGYAVCGLALGCATLVGGGLVFIPVFLPVVLIGLLVPQRSAHITGLFAAGGLAMMTLFPWMVIVHDQQPDAWTHWIAAVIPHGTNHFGDHLQVAGLRLLLILLVAMPWSLWMVFAIAQPFSTSSVGWRSRMFIGWAWFVAVLGLVVVLPGEGALHEVLLLLPVTAVLIGQLFRRLVDLSSEGRHARVWRFGRWPTLGLLVTLSVLVPLGLGLEEPLIDSGWLHDTIAYPVHWSYHLCFGVLLLGLTLLSTRFALKHYPGKSLVCWSIWSIVLVAYLAMPIARGPLMRAAPAEPPPRSVTPDPLASMTPQPHA